MITISSDYHLGLNRTSHTSPASRERLKLAIYEQAKSISSKQSYKVCCGDLFDSYWDNATTLAQGQEILQHTDIVLTGNHDESSRANAVSALSFLRNMSYTDIDDWNSPSQAVVVRTVFNNVHLQWVHHKMTQTLFDTCLEQVESTGGLLFLHCNYDSRFATDESSLNLTKEQAEILLTKVDKIFLGHEHAANEHFGGRLIICGNIHPTSFSDISDKYIYHVDKDLNVTKELVWCKDDSIKVDFKYVLDASVDLGNLEFIEVTGQAEQSELPAIARAITNLWKTCPNAFMIKNSVTCIKQEVVITETTKLTDTLTTISNELRETKLHAIWQDYLGKI